MLGVGIKLIDFKIEIGRVWDGDFQRLILADEISPDSLPPLGHRDRQISWTRTCSAATSAIWQMPIREVAKRLGVLPSNVTHAAKPTLIN